MFKNSTCNLESFNNILECHHGAGGVVCSFQFNFRTLLNDLATFSKVTINEGTLNYSGGGGDKQTKIQKKFALWTDTETFQMVTVGKGTQNYKEKRNLAHYCQGNVLDLRKNLSCLN